MADWIITKFGRHEEGYFHARVTPAGGKTIYVYCRFGSWMAPGIVNGNAVHKEVLGEVAADLADRARKAERAERKEVTQDGASEGEPADPDSEPGDDVHGESAD